MKKLSFLALSALIVTPAFAASTGTLTLSGNVAAVNDITVTPNGTNNTSLNIISGETGKNVASVTESSNDKDGYKIQIHSANGGQLQLAGQPSKYTTYQISYAGGSYTTPPLAASPVTIKNVSSLSALTSATSAVAVNVTAYPTALAGTYSDTVTFAIIGN
ncbi:MAG: fimbrial protein [Bdellovibrionia bacterium]